MSPGSPAFVAGLSPSWRAWRAGRLPLRAEQLAALARAGVVSFVGPDPRFSVDRRAGRFTAVSPWVGSPPVAAATMVEALAPGKPGCRQ